MIELMTFSISAAMTLLCRNFWRKVELSEGGVVVPGRLMGGLQRKQAHGDYANLRDFNGNCEVDTWVGCDIEPREADFSRVR